MMRRYVHLGTGNYNPVTARYYTDLSLLTCDPQITAAVHEVFSYLTAYTERTNYAPLMVAPVDIARQIIQLIERETEHARAHRPARIIAKMNSLLDEEVVEALYRASSAGVHIDLIVRGICSLRPGVRGISSRIKRAQHRWATTRAQPHLLFRKRWRAGTLCRQRRLDASQPIRTRRNRLPDRRPHAPTANSLRGA